MFTYSRIEKGTCIGAYIYVYVYVYTRVHVFTHLSDYFFGVNCKFLKTMLLQSTTLSLIIHIFKLSCRSHNPLGRIYKY